MDVFMNVWMYDVCITASSSFRLATLMKVIATPYYSMFPFPRSPCGRHFFDFLWIIYPYRQYQRQHPIRCKSRTMVAPYAPMRWSLLQFGVDPLVSAGIVDGFFRPIWNIYIKLNHRILPLGLWISKILLNSGNDLSIRKPVMVFSYRIDEEDSRQYDTICQSLKFCMHEGNLIASFWTCP